MLDERECRQAPRHTQNEIGLEPFRQRQRDDAVGIRIVSDRGGKADAEPGTREVDSGVESVAGASHRERAISAAA